MVELVAQRSGVHVLRYIVGSLKMVLLGSKGGDWIEQGGIMWHGYGCIVTCLNKNAENC